MSTCAGDVEPKYTCFLWALCSTEHEAPRVGGRNRVTQPTPKLLSIVSGNGLMLRRRSSHDMDLI